jgi:hypothetical protein
MSNDLFDFDSDAPAEPQPVPAFSTEPAPTVRATAGGITMEIDLHQMLTAIDPGGRWIGYDPEEDEDRYEPSSLALQIADLTADRLAKAMRREVTSMIEDKVAETVQAEVIQLVRNAISAGEVQETNEFGRPTGPAKPLTEVVITIARSMFKAPDRYNTNRLTPMQKMIEEEVGRTFKTELAAAVKDAKTAALQAVQQNAAEVIRETIERSARGL